MVKYINKINEARRLDTLSRDLVYVVAQYHQYLMVMNETNKREFPFVMTIIEWDKLQLA